MNTPVSLKCLSFKQPNAWMLFHGKNIESQNYSIKHRGMTLIHAGNFGNKRILQVLTKQMDAYKITPPSPTALPTQAIIGSIELVACHWSDEAYAYHWYFEKPHLWEKQLPFVAKNILFDIPLQLVDSHGITF